MLDYALLTAYVAAIVLFLGTPGPVTVLVASASAQDGFWAGLKTVIGTNTASLLLIALSFAILQGVFSVSETALNWLTLAGSLYLLHFALDLLRHPPQIGQAPENAAAKPSRQHFRQGFLVAISNPKDILFFIAFFPTFLGIFPSSRTTSMLLLALIWVLLDYAILSTYSLLFSRIQHARALRVIHTLSGVLLALVALYALYATATALLDG